MHCSGCLGGGRLSNAHERMWRHVNVKYGYIAGDDGNDDLPKLHTTKDNGTSGRNAGCSPARNCDPALVDVGTLRRGLSSGAALPPMFCTLRLKLLLLLLLSQCLLVHASTRVVADAVLATTTSP